MPAGGHIHILSPRQWTRHLGLLPIVGCFIAGTSLGFTYVCYMCATKPDISFRPTVWKEDAPWKFIKENEARRLKSYIKPMPSIDPAILQLRREIGSYKG